ncbi:MAG: SH3 domain-containing protein [Arthrobacter sp.]|uniref:SH3 domain-containing protein n=1 Tax=Arthrobacter sp. TaxID=1667 RepID=UPI00349B4326
MKRTSHSLWSTLSIAALLAGGMAAGPAAAPAFAASDRVALPLDPKTYRFSSTHGPRCIPVMNGTTAHQGQDLAASDGNNIYAVADGIVTQTRKGTRGGVSGYVVVRHYLGGKTYYTAYIHMWDGNEFARVGQSVRAGQKIGEVGNSGPSTAPHLHFEVWGAAGWMRGSSLDPMKWLLDRGVDVKRNASVVYNFTLPTSCSYWAARDLNLRATASASAKNLKLVKKGAKMTSVPGAQLNGYIRVTTGGTTGWAIHGAVAPFVVHPVPEKIDVQPLSTIYYTATANVNLREGPSTAYRSLGTISKDTKVKVTGKAGSWLRVVHGSKTGFVSASYLKISAPAAPKPPVVTKPKVVDVKDKTMQVVANHNLRVSASSAARAVATVRQGARVTVTHTFRSWSKVAYAGRSGWMASYALKAPTATPAATTTRTTTANLHLREGAGTQYRSLVLIGSGSAVRVSSTSNGWSKVTYAGKTGWASSAYLK